MWNIILNCPPKGQDAGDTASLSFGLPESLARAWEGNPTGGRAQGLAGQLGAGFAPQEREGVGRLTLGTGDAFEPLE
jgi:hypothetical protein